MAQFPRRPLLGNRVNIGKGAGSAPFCRHNYLENDTSESCTQPHGLAALRWVKEIARRSFLGGPKGVEGLRCIRLILTMIAILAVMLVGTMASPASAQSLCEWTYFDE